LDANELKNVIAPAALKSADPDNDGTISRDEYLALVEKLSTRADADKDRTLSANELASKTGQRLRRLID
jgi:hypothetical protein